MADTRSANAKLIILSSFHLLTRRSVEFLIRGPAAEHQSSAPVPSVSPIRRTIILNRSAFKIVADEVGFEPTEPCGSLVFKTSSLILSDTHPTLLWRTERDSNPRYLSVYTLSRRAPSTARPPVHYRSNTFPSYASTVSARAASNIAACFRM